jgi:hypothetical protein
LIREKKYIILARRYLVYCSVVDPDHFDADLDADPDLDPDPSFQIKAQTLEKVLKQAHIPYILACHLQTEAAGSGSGSSFSL